MMKNMRLLFFLLALSFKGFGQIQVKVIPLSPQALKVLNIKGDYESYQIEVKQIFRDFFTTYAIGYDIKVLESIHSNQKPVYVFYSKPALPAATLQLLSEELAKLPPIYAHHKSYYSEYDIQINGGCEDRALTYSPAYKNHNQSCKENWYSMDDDSQLFQLKDWINTYSIPVLKRFANSTDSVRYGLSERSFLSISTGNLDSLTAHNAVYWDQFLKDSTAHSASLLPLILANLYAHNGQFDYVNLQLKMLYNFTEPGTIEYYFIEELSWRIQYLMNREAEKISVSKAYLEAGSIENALQVLGEVYAQNENSVQAIFYYALAGQQSIKDKLKYPNLIEDAPARIKELFPYLSASLEIKNKKENYLISRKLEAEEYFVDDITYDDDFRKLADLAVEVEDYTLAATLFHFLTIHPKGNFKASDATQFRDYCLFQLDYNIKTKARYPKIKRYYKKRMKKHSAYKKFKS